MPPQNRPQKHEARKCWKFTFRGKTVYFGKDIPYEERPQIDGVPSRAWKYMAEYIENHQAKPVDLNRLTVIQICQAYLAWAAGEMREQRMTVGNYRGHECHLSKFWEWSPGPRQPAYADRVANEMDAADLEAFANAMRSDGLSVNYVSNLCKSVQACFNWAIKPVKSRNPVRYLTLNPFKGYRPPKPTKSSDKFIEARHLRAFLRWAWKRARRSIGWQRRFDLIFVRMLWFLYLTGARPGEACDARWSGVRWREGILVIEEWKNKAKTGNARVIHLTPAVVRLLRRIKRLEGHHPEWIFTHALGKRQSAYATSSEGMPWNSVALSTKIRMWRKAAKREWEDARKAGVDVGDLPIATEGGGRFVAYLLRHTYISEGLHAGLSESEVADLTGTSAEMVQGVYGHIQRKHAAEKAKQIAERLSSTSSSDRP